MSQTVIESPSSMSKPTQRPSVLRRVLALNAGTSLAAGLAAAVAPAAIGDLLGLVGDGADLIVRLVGIGLVVFAIDVALAARRTDEETLARNAGLISVADVAWVVATVVVLAGVEMSSVGRLIAVAMGLGVAGFAALQLRLR